ncbi:hypothetical protein Q2366_26130, partial [Escherichia coli]|nr:hypothetical protein [Escherichia coli]
MTDQSSASAHNTQKSRGRKSRVEVLFLTAHERHSSPSRYDIEFPSPENASEPEAVLMQGGAFSLGPPPVQGMPVQVPLR